MDISKKDAIMWFEFFAQLPDEEQLLPRQQEIAYAALNQLELAAEKRFDALIARIPHIKSLHGRTLYTGEDKRFPMGCRSCLLGTGLSAIRKTNRCNLSCPFCYDYGALDTVPPIGDGLWEIGGTRLRECDIESALSIQHPPTGISYVYLEPFMEIEKYYGVIALFHRHGVHQHLYTNGTLCTPDTLRALGEAGLDELRFNLGASRCSDGVIASMAQAKDYIPQVGIETPMTPDFYEGFHRKKDDILSTGIDFMNCAELHLNENNLMNYMGEPLYATRLGYVSPVWSRELTLRLMAEACAEEWPIVIHDCCNLTKLRRDLNLRGKEGGWFGASGYACEFDGLPYAAFLPALRDETMPFEREEPLPKGYRPQDIVL